MATPEHTLELRAILATILRRRWFILVPVVLITLSALVASFLITPLFESAVLVYESNPVSLSAGVLRMLGDYRNIVSGLDSKRVKITDLERELRTPAYVSRIIEAAGLDQDSSVSLQVRELQSRYPERAADELKIDVVADMVSRQMKLEYVTASHLLISVQATTPHQARDLAKSIGDVFIAEKHRQSEQAVYRSLQFAYDELAKREADLKGKMDERTRLEQDIASVEAGGQVPAQQAKRALETEIERRRFETEELESRERRLTAELDRTSAGELSIDESPAMSRGIRRLDTLVERLALVISTGAERDPAVQEMQVRIVQTEDEIEREHRSLVARKYSGIDADTQDRMVSLLGIKLRKQYLKKYVEALREGLRVQGSRGRSLPELRGRLELMDQQIAAAQRLRDNLKDQQEVFELSLSLVQQSNYEIVEEAELHLAPVWPDRRLIAASGLLVGLLLGAAAIFIVEASDRSFTTPEQVVSYLNVPVAGVVPSIEGLSVRGESP